MHRSKMFFLFNGSRFGCLHPFIGCSYQTLCIPILLYGAEIWTKVELNMLEWVHWNILRTPWSPYTRCHSSSLSYMLGSNNIESMIFQRKLNFISLDNNSLPKKLLIKRTQDPLVKGLILDLQTTLLCLPSINILRLHGQPN